MSNNAPIFAFTVSGYTKTLVISGFDNPDYNTKRAKFELIRTHHVPNATPVKELVAKLDWRTPITKYSEPGEYRLIPLSGKLTTLQSLSFVAKANSKTPDYLRNMEPSCTHS